MAMLLKYILLLVLIFPEFVSGRQIQILHTNDTHSFFNHIPHVGEKGGFSRLKFLIDKYRQIGEKENLSTLVLDAGDFTEGNIYYMAQNGRKSFQMLQEMGFDVVTLGNHDYLMGMSELNSLLGELNLKFSMLAANLEVDSKFATVREKISPYKEFEIDGIKLAILGLTSDEIFYKWRVAEGEIKNPIEVANYYEKLLKDRKNDFIIGLTHIGVLKDLKLAKRSSFIDLIIGGHSHTEIFTPLYELNKQKNEVPVIQTGKYAEYLGRVVLELEKGKPLKIVSYELIPVIEDNNSGNEVIKKIVEESEEELNNLFGKSWLDELIGNSDLLPKDPRGAEKWSYFVADAFKEKTGADIAIHSAEINGDNYPVGKINRRDVINSFPRVFDVHDRSGWSIYTTKVKGVWLRLTVEALTRYGQPLTFSGLKVIYEKSPLGFKFKRIFVNGKKIDPFKTYLIAVSEGIVRGAEGVNSKSVAILRNPHNTGHRIWETLEEKIKKIKFHALHSKVYNNHTVFR